MSKIIVYADRGVDGMALKQLIKSLQETIDPSAHILKRMDAKSLLEESWEKDTSLVVIPGGRDVFYHEALDGRGTDKLRAFVRNGGNYSEFARGVFCLLVNQVPKRGAIRGLRKALPSIFSRSGHWTCLWARQISYEPEHSLRGAVAAENFLERGRAPYLF